MLSVLSKTLFLTNFKAKLWKLDDIKNPKLLYSYDEHCGEIISLTFDHQVNFVESLYISHYFLKKTWSNFP